MRKGTSAATDGLKDVSLMIPIYNEEDCLYGVVSDLIQALCEEHISHDIFLVNNGSWDGSAQIIERLKKEHPKDIHVVTYRENKKLGGAVNRVTRKYLKGKVIGYTCADGEVTAKDSAKLLRRLLDNPEYALAKTVRLNRADGYRKHISLIYNTLVKILFGIKTRDINGWPVFIRYEIFRKMKLRNYNWAYPLEYLYQVKKLHKTFFEIDVEHQRRKGGKSKVNSWVLIDSTWELFSYRLQTLFQYR